MPRFTSGRERRLWGWALAVVAAIFATVGLAGTLAEALGERGLLDGVFFAGFLLAVAAVVAGGLRSGSGRREIWIGLSVAAVCITVVVRMGIGPAERTHLFEYGLLALLVHQALLERRRNGRRVPAPAVVAVVCTALLGWFDEGLQGLIPNRQYDLRDVGVNALAGLAAVTASSTLAWVRRWRFFAGRPG